MLRVGYSGNAYTIEVNKCCSQGFFFFQRSEFSHVNNYQYSTACSAKISPESRVCVYLAALELSLKDGAHPSEGRLKVKHQGEWGTVNDHNWSMEEAAVVCRSLGCGGAVGAPQRAKFGPGIGPIWFHYTYCKGQESAITKCSYPAVKDQRPEGHSHGKDAGAVCSG